MRAFLLVIDSFGIGELPDASAYRDAGSNTAVHIGEKLGKVNWPTLRKLGLGNAAQLLGKTIPGCEPLQNPDGSFSVMKEVSPGKDTTTGHWELAGIQLTEAFPTFPPGPPSFPKELLDELSQKSGYTFLGDKAASGTEIIEELGKQHMETGKPIIYTSGDSVVQIAAHEEVISLEKLYELCALARKISDRWKVGRVIARPFLGLPGSFHRTPGRHDYSIALPGPTILDHLQKFGVKTVGVGKIGDIFNGQGLSKSFPDKGNPACLERTLSLAKDDEKGNVFVFVNLVDTDMVYGHRRDPQGYHDSVAETDTVLKNLMANLRTDDLLLISADHGCDPTFRGSDHTREHVPFLGWQPSQAGKNWGVRSTFADAAQTLATFFRVSPFPIGHSVF